tara:strand:- start:299 stop:589 length:291 start_codon:yes stop_codon:yes gene_type:complete
VAVAVALVRVVMMLVDILLVLILVLVAQESKFKLPVIPTITSIMVEEEAVVLGDKHLDIVILTTMLDKVVKEVAEEVVPLVRLLLDMIHGWIQVKI